MRILALTAVQVIFCCTRKISAQTNDCVMFMVFWTCVYCLEAVKQASAVTVDLWITSRWMAGTVTIWSHLSQQINFIGWH
jgi:ribosomal protein S2